MKEDALMRETLDEHVYKRYIAGKEREWDEYRTRVTDWELQKYMIVY